MSELERAILRGRTPLQVLQMPEDATFEDAKASYRRLLLTFHPDKNRSDMAPQVFEAIKMAFATLQQQQALTTGRDHGGRPFEEFLHQDGRACCEDWSTSRWSAPQPPKPSSSSWGQVTHQPYARVSSFLVPPVNEEVPVAGATHLKGPRQAVTAGDKAHDQLARRGTGGDKSRLGTHWPEHENRPDCCSDLETHSPGTTVSGTVDEVDDTDSIESWGPGPPRAGGSPGPLTASHGGSWAEARGKSLPYYRVQLPATLWMSVGTLPEGSGGQRYQADENVTAIGASRPPRSKRRRLSSPPRPEPEQSVQDDEIQLPHGPPSPQHLCQLSPRKGKAQLQSGQSVATTKTKTQAKRADLTARASLQSSRRQQIPELLKVPRPRVDGIPDARGQKVADESQTSCRLSAALHVLEVDPGLSGLLLRARRPRKNSKGSPDGLSPPSGSHLLDTPPASVRQQWQDIFRGQGQVNVGSKCPKKSHEGQGRCSGDTGATRVQGTDADVLAATRVAALHLKKASRRAVMKSRRGKR